MHVEHPASQVEEKEMVVDPWSVKGSSKGSVELCGLKGFVSSWPMVKNASFLTENIGTLDLQLKAEF